MCGGIRCVLVRHCRAVSRCRRTAPASAFTGMNPLARIWLKISSWYQSPVAGSTISLALVSAKVPSVRRQRRLAVDRLRLADEADLADVVQRGRGGLRDVGFEPFEYTLYR